MLRLMLEGLLEGLDSDRHPTALFPSRVVSVLMTLSECYQLLGLEDGASAAEVKSSYRRLVRRYHPDVNPDNPEWAKVKFIELTRAYESVTHALKSSHHPSFRRASAVNPSSTTGNGSTPHSPRRSPSSSPKARSSPSSSNRPPSPQAPPPIRIRQNPALSDIDNQLKKNSYQQLQELLRSKRFARAIALVEGLVHRIPSDPEVKQWQAIAYQQYARHFTNENQYSKAKIYLKKALRVDPHNRKLWSDIKEEFNRLEQTLLKQQS
jgi:curved DNA-binding protein CbpA